MIGVRTKGVMKGDTRSSDYSHLVCSWGPKRLHGNPFGPYISTTCLNGPFGQV